ncbi:MAG: GGDEF domain-containing protein [Gaiellaceae bacterium]
MRRPAPRDPIFSGLNPAAAAFEFAVVWVTVAGAVLMALPTEIGRSDWRTFGILLPIIAVVHLVGAERQKHQGSHLSLAPIFAAVLLLPPALAALAIGVAFVPEWIRARPRWYIVVFNVANFVGPALAARACFDAFQGPGDGGWALGAIIAILAFVLVQYTALAIMLRLARGVRIAHTVRVDCVLIDAGLVSLGAVAAALWELNQGLVALTLLPLALAYRSLAIPGLVEATRVEPKTGLYNMRHFQSVLSQELQRAGRFDRPVAVLMIDIDHLRDINTARGHLAGDRALKTVASALEEATREYDVAARFGGDEFCVVLPETELEGALVVAERIRNLVEQSPLDPKVTVSVGVAYHRGTGTTPDALLALADRAAYRAKFSGRNAIAIPPEGDPVDEAERLLLDSIG